EVNTATKRRWVVDFAFRYGTFYDGTLRQFQPGVTLKPSRYLSLVFQMERDEARLPYGSFVTQLFSGGVNISFSPDLRWSSLGQYDSDSGILGLQSRLRWTLKPGNDIFVSVGRGWFRRLEGDYLPSFDRGSAKLQYTFRL